MRRISLTSGKALKTLTIAVTCAMIVAGVKSAVSQVAINTTGDPANENAVLDVSSSDQCVLVPRFTTANRPSNNLVAGLLYYQTDAPQGFYYYNGTTWVRLGNSPATYYNTPSDPPSTNSSTGVMMGLGVTNSFTPQVTGKARVLITGSLGSSGSSSNGFVQIRYGTGTAPSNGSALTGTTLGALKKSTVTSPTTVGFTLCGIVSGLNVGTGYWVDVSLKNSTGLNTVSLYNIDIVIDEIQ